MPRSAEEYARLAARIKTWGRELGFQAVGIADTDLATGEARLAAWVKRGWHGEMDYMARHGARRARPSELVPGTLRVIACRMNYAAAPQDARIAPDAQQEWAAQEWAALADPRRAFVACYARGRDYHKVLRARLERLAQRIAAEGGGHGYRVFTDSAPVLEVELAAKAGLGWRGKHTLLLAREAGSYFFLGEIYTDLPLPVDAPVPAHCGSCAKCIDACPTQAIRAPYSLDARRCISYLTIELKGSIPLELRALIGNRVYGCDDCQLACPWNRFAQVSAEPDFAVRNGLDQASLVELFGWSEAQFRARMAGSAIRRIGYERWLRNLAVGLGNALRELGNAPEAANLVAALRAREDEPSAMVREHVSWALAQRR